MRDIKTVKYFGVTSEQFIGYFYSGLLASLIFALLEPSKVKTVVDSLGNILSIFIALGIGIGLYTIYFQIVGEFFLFQLQRLIHHVFDRLLGNRNENQTSSTGYLGYLGVPFIMRRKAYESIKNDFDGDPVKLNLHLSHGEIHVLYITSIFLLAASFYSYTVGYENSVKWLSFGLIFLFGGLISDTKQHIKETHIFKSIGREKIRQFLVERKLIQ